jgi:hypothetical protein
MFMLFKKKKIIIKEIKLENVNMFWYDLKLWQFFKTKHKIKQKLYTFKNSYSFKIDCKKNWHIGATINKKIKIFQNI